MFDDPSYKDGHHIHGRAGLTHALVVKDLLHGDGHYHAVSLHSSIESAVAALNHWLKTRPRIPESSLATVADIRPSDD